MCFCRETRTRAGSFSIQLLRNVPRFAGAEGGSQVLRGKVRGTISAAAGSVVTSPPANITELMDVTASHF